MSVSDPLLRGSLLGAIAAASLLVACPKGGSTDHAGGDPPIAEPSTVDGLEIVRLEQGWTEEIIHQFNSRGAGSLFMPWSWFLVLERAQDQVLFRSKENIEPMHYVVDGPTPGNPEGAPLGIGKSIEAKSKRAYAGLTCASCHLGQIEYGGKAIRIQGGAGLGSINLLLGGMLDGARATAEDDAKFTRFVAALRAGGEEVDDAALRDELRAWVALRTPQIAMNTSKLDYGPGRLDALGAIANDVTVTFLGIDANIHDPSGAVSYPPIWDTNRFDLTQWNGSGPNKGPGVLAQNVAQVLGVYPEITVDPSKPGGYASSVDVGYLGEIQAWAKELRRPAWPTEVFGAVDAALAEEGEDVYLGECLSCHILLDPNEHKSAIDVTMVKVDEVGTDPLAADNFVQRYALSGPLEGHKAQFMVGEKLGEKAFSQDLVGNVVAGVIVHQLGESMIAMAEGGTAGVDDAPAFDPRSYKARPLDGVWATAPYLHNGSVRTLAQLLVAPEQREQSFVLGNRSFDPVDVGYVSEAAPGSWTFDCSLEGNRNIGHAYGTELSDDKKRALLEFLKTL